MPSVYDLLDVRYGAPTEQIEYPEGVTTAGVNDAIILRQDARRLSYTFWNLSANSITLRPGGPASATQGITLPSGSGVTVGYPDDLHMAALEWHAIATGAGSAFYLTTVRYQAVAGQTPSAGVVA